MGEEQESKSGGIGCLKLTGIGCGVLGIVAIVAVIWFVVKAKQIATNMGQAAVTAMVEQSGLSPEEKKAILVRVDCIAEDYKSGEITNEQLGRIMKVLADGPLLPLGTVRSVWARHEGKSGLSAEEKKAAELTLQRFSRGVVEKKIPATALKPILAPVMQTNAAGQKAMNQFVTDDELRAFLKAIKEEADKAKIPNEPYKVDIVKEIDKAIDAALRPASATSPGAAVAPTGK